MVTLGATFLYAAMSGSHPTLASVIDVSVSVTGFPPAALPLPLSLELLSWVPLPQATTAAAVSATPALQTQGRNRVDLVITGLSSSYDPTSGTAWRRSTPFAPWKSPSSRADCAS